ncbi:hypothetical protein WJX72_000991 [[Myrmecia] bisecta]|uniref:Uncharacterized protein n=1 Tax=[Myrmecia] bisecta TaxID=41462 RepID=A0AAW1PGF8_9CHLO
MANDVIKVKVTKKGASNTQWDTAGLCDDLSLFAKACQVPEVQEQILELRPAGFQDRPGTTIFTGTPGIGKSHLGGAVVGKALVIGRPVLLEIVSSDKEVHKQRSWYWIPPSGDVERTDNAMMGNERLKEAANAGMDPLYVVDGGVPSLDENLWYGEAYVFSSPKQNLWHQETKGARTLTFYVPLFNFEELQLCKNGLTTYKGMSDEDLSLRLMLCLVHACIGRCLCNNSLAG